MTDPELIDRFVAAFHHIDRPVNEDRDRHKAQGGVVTTITGSNWKPAAVKSDRSILKEIYRELPSPFPPLYEQLVLSYRWPQIDLRTLTLLANPPGPTLRGLLQEIRRDPVFTDVLLPNKLRNETGTHVVSGGMGNETGE